MIMTINIIMMINIVICRHERTDLRVLPGLNKVSEIHRHALQAVYLLNPVNKATTALDYERIMTFFCSLPYFFKE